MVGIRSDVPDDPLARGGRPHQERRQTAHCGAGHGRRVRWGATAMIDLTGQVALVTGSSRGIGRACAVRLAEAGADVVVNYITSRSAAEEVAAAIQGLGRRTAVVKADIS